MWLRGGRNVGKAVDALAAWLMPVIKPSTNTAFAAAEFSPIGAARGGYGLARAALTKGLKEMPAAEKANLLKLIDHGAAGTALMTLGAYLYSQKAITGSYREGNAKDVDAYKTPRPQTRTLAQ